MSESVVILDYANPRPDRPANSRLIVEILADGVRVTDPPGPSHGTLGIRSGWVMLSLSFVVALALVVSGKLREEAKSIVSPIGIGLIGFAVISAGKKAARQPLVIEARDGVLTLCPRSGFRNRYTWRYRRVRKFYITMPSSDLLTGRLLCHLQIHSTLGGSTVLLTNHPVEECRWVADLLQREVNRADEFPSAPKISPHVRV